MSTKEAQFNPDQLFAEELIVCTKKRRGDGVKAPIRVVTEVFNKSGQLVAESDPLKFSIEEILKAPKIDSTVKEDLVFYLHQTRSAS
jgi:hypothetical protein